MTKTTHPVTEALVDGRKRQHGHRQQEVAQSEVADEQVGDVAQAGKAQQREADEQVAEHGRNVRWPRGQWRSQGSLLLLLLLCRTLS